MKKERKEKKKKGKISCCIYNETWGVYNLVGGAQNLRAQSLLLCCGNKNWVNFKTFSCIRSFHHNDP
jgi:hypothetical protein